MARRGILYEQVVEAITALQAESRKITVRAIHAQTGGSMSTVLKHYRRWQYEQSEGASDSPEISHRLAEALRDEFQRHARRAVQAMEKRVQAGNEQLDQTHDRLAALKRELVQARAEVGGMAARIEKLEHLLQKADARATRAETQLQKLRRKPVLPQGNASPAAKPPSPCPSPDQQQEAFEF